jgi:hypothetical protein
MDEKVEGKEHWDGNLAPIPERSLSLRLALSLPATSHQLAPFVHLGKTYL